MGVGWEDATVPVHMSVDSSVAPHVCLCMLVPGASPTGVQRSGGQGPPYTMNIPTWQ